MKITKFTLGVLSIASFCVCIQLPPNLRKCSRTQSDFSDCLVKATEGALRLLINPIPELGLPNFEPLEFHTASFPKGKRILHFEQNFRDIKINGIPHSKVLNFNIDFDKKTIYFECIVPLLHGEVKYDFNGKFFGQPLNANGFYLFEYSNVHNNLTATFEEFEKDGDRYMTVIGNDNVMTTEKRYFNITSDDVETGKRLTELYNKHSDAIMEDIEYIYDQFYLNVFVVSFNSVLSRVPLKDIFD